MNNAWDLRQIILDKIEKNGGWVNTHTHLDRAFTITPETLGLANATLQEKWGLVDEIKRSSSIDQIYDRMAYAIERQIAQGVKVLGSFIDVDDVIGDKAMKAADKVRNKYKGEIEIKFINQALKGVINPVERKWFDEALSFVDIIGGLPKKDEGHEEEHLDILFNSAKKLNKMVHVHVDQFNSEEEKETEQLISKTEEYGMQGKVVAIHGVSLSAHPKKYREEVYLKMEKSGVMLITCPTAWIDSRRTEVLSVTHNSIAPVEELIAHDVVVGLGTDNIADVYKPFTDGEMWTELRFLLESCHYYDIDQLVNIATVNGRKILGI